MSAAMRIPGTQDTPALVFRASPTYALYHWLRANSSRPASDDRLLAAHRLIGKSFNQRGGRGMVEPWERALATGDDPDQSLRAFQASVRATADDVVMAMRSAERIFMDEAWPGHKANIDAGLGAVRHTFGPGFPEMAREHAALLDLEWPPEIEVNLIGAMEGTQGAYSHPLTIDASHHRGLTLFETILHESTHVAEVSGLARGHACLGSRLRAFLGEQGLSPTQSFNIWHAVIFAASGSAIRRRISLDHEDYATPRKLYAYFGLPGVAGFWHAYIDDGRDEHRLRQALLGDFRAARRSATS